MGRRIYDNTGEFVWKYAFGSQDSEMQRICTEFHIGKYLMEHKNDWQYGKLNLNRTDVKNLRTLVKDNEAMTNDVNEREKKLFGDTGLASFEKVRKMEADLQAKYPDQSIYFFPMCEAIMEKAEEYFAVNPRRRVYTLEDEF